MLEQLKNLIDSHSVISFDMFDTLVVRSYNKPVDLFKHIEISKGIKNFQKLRQKAEEIARIKAMKHGREDTTIDEIYGELPHSLLPLKQIEIAQEINVCSDDKYMHEIFDYAISKGKIVIITSDMYLDKGTITAILNKNGYKNYNYLFLSSDVKLSKSSGNLYRKIIEQLQCKPSDILHVGDNQFGDHEIPKQMGIDCWLYETAKKINAKQETERLLLSFTEYSDQIPISIANSLILTRNFEKHDAWENFGYKYGGLMLYGYCDWLNRQFIKNKIHNIVFASRDGYIPMRIFEKFYPDFDIKYFYASRRAYLFAGMEQVDKKFLEYVVDQIGNNLTFESYWNSLKIEDKQLTQKFQKQFDLKSVISDADKLNIKQFFINNEVDVLRYAKKERDTSMKYFKQVGLLDKKVALVDIGWRASIQKNIISTIKQSKKKHNIQGFYLATHRFKYKCKLVVNAFLQNQSVPSNIADIVDPMCLVFELICSAPHLGCVKIIDKNGKYAPLEQHSNPMEEARIYASGKICKGIMDFVRDFKQIVDPLPISVSPSCCVAAFINFFDSLNNETKDVLSKISFTTGCGDIENYTSLLDWLSINNRNYPTKTHQTFFIGIPFSYQQRTDTCFVDSRLFGLYKKEFKGLYMRIYIFGIRIKKVKISKYE